MADESLKPQVLKLSSTSKVAQTSFRSNWLKLVHLLTCCFPYFCLQRFISNPSRQLAWREKVALCIIILLSWGLFLFYIIGIPLLMCPKTTGKSEGELSSYTTFEKPLVGLYGQIYTAKPQIQDHVFAKQYINAQAFKSVVLGQDVTPMFYKVLLCSDLG